MGRNSTGRVLAIPRQERALRTRADLLAATEALVAAEGVASVTTTRIASMTGVSVGTIYRYFPDGGALMLAAYDATVERVIETCAARLASLDPALPARDAALAIIDAYVSAAEAIPAHRPLLAEMRRRRVIADDRISDAAVIESRVFLPLLARYGLDRAAREPGRLLPVYALVSVLVDLVLMADDAAARAAIRSELEAHALFALSRL